MPLKSNISRVQAEQEHSGLSIFKRIANFAIAILLAFIIIYLWLNNVIQDQRQLEQQASQLGRTLSQQHALIIKDKLQQKDLKSIEKQLNYLESDPHIFSVALFDEKGQKILGSQNDTDMVSVFSASQDKGLLVFVQDIHQDNQVIGYLRVLLLREQVLAFFSQYQKEILYQALLLVILAFLMGILVTRGFYKIKYKLQ
ncbi:AhpA/YtjB family protein [Neptunicella marina]|uniref:Uncharacterized protein n=1 Tax=Neptunicella marina TaxID=2125989 RepID=A0A8J6IUF7_9ALTE|nr:AhpA/YtjB family protein [Neptunicella marina]MBC3766891.1 hypothetical protein [Neptunicella marina]